MAENRGPIQDGAPQERERDKFLGLPENRAQGTSGIGASGYTREELLERRSSLRRRRRNGRRRNFVGLLLLVAVIGLVVAGGGGGGGRASHASRLATSSPRRSPAPAIQLPRGGRTILPGHLVVAYYGIVGTSNILGQTHDPEADAAGVQRQATANARYGRPVQPAFELVATIASPDPGPSGTYSSPVDSGTITRYLRAAHRHRLLLILDFQPGRGEFLPEVRRYARFLLDPAVGVALDPEWKLTNDQVPDQAIGSSSSAAINAVSSYLSTLVYRYRLPQKLFIVHEFRLSELPDRQHIAFRPGLATVLQMDGLGSVAVKRAAYHQVMRGAGKFFPGFKVFLQRSNDPILMSPKRIMKLRPQPAYVSYQ